MNLSMAFDNSFVVMNEEEMHDVNGGWSVDIGWKKIFWNVKRPVLKSITFSYGDVLAIVGAGIGAIIAIGVAVNALPVVGQITSAAIFACSVKILAACFGFFAAVIATNDDFINWKDTAFKFSF